MKTMREKLLNLPGMGWKERGQAMTELALAIIVLIILLSVVLDLGRAFFTYLALQNAAGEGAYYGSAFPENVGTVGTTNKDTIIYRAQNESPIAAELINWQSANVEVSYPVSGYAKRGEPIKVRITYVFPFVGPLPHLFGMSQITMGAEAVQTTLASTEADKTTPLPSPTPDQNTAHIEKFIPIEVKDGGNWSASVTVYIHKQDHTVAPGVVVTGKWTISGVDTAFTCTTDSGGKCKPEDTPWLKNNKCAIFTVVTPPNGPHGQINPLTICG